jgi:hypothetical protein
VSLWRPEAPIEIRVGTAPGGEVLPRAGGLRVEALVAEFERQLDAQAPGRRGRSVCGVVGGDAVRYAIVPWIEALSSPLARQRQAEQGMVEIYGDAARQWTLRLQSSRYGASTLACAIESTLDERLGAAARKRDFALVSLQPALMHAFNRERRQLPPGLFWFALTEQRWLTLLLMSKSQPLQVKQMPFAGGDLGPLLDREWFSLGIEAPRCPVHQFVLSASSDGSNSLPTTGWPEPARRHSLQAQA